MTLRWSEPRHDALRTAADGRLTFQAGMAGSTGSYWAQLPGMPEDEKTTSPRFTATVTALVASGYLRHVNPGRMRSGAVEITGPGTDTLRRFNETTARSANT
jgi:hypothetical protein